MPRVAVVAARPNDWRRGVCGWWRYRSSSMIERVVQRVEAGQSLSVAEMEETMDVVIQGQCPEDLVARLLLALRRKGETVEEVAGAAAALRKHVCPIRSRRSDVLDTCGTGGDGSRTFNISTAAALVAAAAGVPVAKHGNRAVTSRSGSADVLAALGVNIEADVARVEACLEELGICFCFAPLLHQAMRHVAPVRKRLGVPTIFNLLGPLTNPAGATRQLLGVGRRDLQPLLAEALRLLGTRRAVVVHGLEGLDEVSLSGPTCAAQVGPDGVQWFQWEPADFGVPAQAMDDLVVEGPQHSAEVIRRVLAGQRGPARDVVILNAAAALWVAGRAESPAACARMAAEAIDSRAAETLLARLAERTHA